MKKAAIFTEVSLKAFWDIMGEFATALEETFSSCPETKDWCLYMRNVVQGNDAKMKESIEKWCTGLQKPLRKAKYAKAVQSILDGSPATVYHAIAYHDMEAAEAAFETLQTLELSSKLKSDAMDDEARTVFWKYLEELNKHAFAFSKVTPPRVPTPEEIAQDIQRRKGGTSAAGTPSSAPPGPALNQGLTDVWRLLCTVRGGVVVDGDGDLAERLSTTLKASHGDGGSLGDGCRAHDPAAFAALVDATGSELGSGTEAPTDEHWTLLDKVLGLLAMSSAIPAPMMRGIESVADQLIKDIAAGNTDLGSLNLEAIGQQVLSNVDAKDVSSFASNMDKLLPALQQMQQTPP